MIIHLLAQSRITNPQLPASYASFSGWGFIQYIVTRLIGFSLLIAVIVFTFVILISGFQWITSGGDKAKIESARSRLTNSLIGIFLVFSLFMLIRVINYLFHINIGGLGISQLFTRLTPGSQFQNLTSLQVQPLISGFIQAALVGATLIFFFIILAGGITWLTSAGNKIAIETARHRITQAVIGLFIVFAVFVAIQVINIFFHVNIGNLGIGFGGNPTQPPQACIQNGQACIPNSGVVCCSNICFNNLCVASIPTTAMPTPTPIIILNSASNTSCQVMCALLGTCRTVGYDSAATNMSQVTGDATGCSTAPADCFTIMSHSVPAQNCSVSGSPSYSANWIRCSCYF